jgi:lysophospholipase L1-like esterase
MLNRFWFIFAIFFISVSGKTDESPIVFMGDSITEGWSQLNPSFFEGKPYINRGISGETTQEMLKRFQKDVIDSKPSIVVILAGTNDIAENSGPIPLENVAENIIAMTKMAEANKIRVILCSVLPTSDFPWRSGLKPTEKIVQLNNMIKDYARSNRLRYVDYYSSLVDKHHGMKSVYSEDGVHPNIAGYKVMEPLIEEAIETTKVQLLN